MIEACLHNMGTTDLLALKPGKESPSVALLFIEILLKIDKLKQPAHT